MKFKINERTLSGFQMTFDNEWTVSVQWGSGTYTDNHYRSFGDKCVVSSNAEIAAWDKDGNWHPFEDDTVKGWCSANQVAEFINLIANK